MNEEYPATPELDKMIAAKPQAQIIGDFIDWLHSEGYDICEYEEARDYGEWRQTQKTIEQLIAGHLDINLNKCEKERNAVLEYVRKVNQQ